ncbi:Uncharacterised protein [Chryseobacterium gleum]|uniref:Uncharacterized protein n=1 Tax=Chryseobacterium gleum TaxID=250 RepID=A0A448B0F8_CHRGE|nr:Uncharacterised protein [Chryseobacterium gleum]
MAEMLNPMEKLICDFAIFILPLIKIGRIIALASQEPIN